MDGELQHTDSHRMPSFTPIIVAESTTSLKCLLLELPEEIKLMIYNLCMASIATQAQDRLSFVESASCLPELRMDATEFWVRNGYVLQNADFHMVEVCDGDIAMHHCFDDDAVYHKGHKACDWDGKGASYSMVLMDDDPEDVPQQVEEWMARQGAVDKPCICLS